MDADDVDIYDKLRAELRALPHKELWTIKVGANDGLTGDPFGQLLLEDTRWRGFLIEPVEHYRKLLEQNFGGTGRFEIFPYACGVSGLRTLYYVDPRMRMTCPEFPEWVDQLASFDRQHIEKHFTGMDVEYIKQTLVPSIPLDTFAQMSPPRIDLLHIDAEGADFEILSGFSYQPAPKFLVFEHCHLTESQLYILAENLHRQCYTAEFSGLDCICRLQEKRNDRPSGIAAGPRHVPQSPGSGRGHDPQDDPGIRADAG